MPPFAVAGHGGCQGGGTHEAEKVPARETVLGRQAMHIVVVGHGPGQELVLGGPLGRRRLDALLEGPPEPRHFDGAMFGKSGLHGAILSS